MPQLPRAIWRVSLGIVQGSPLALDSLSARGFGAECYRRRPYHGEAVNYCQCPADVCLLGLMGHHDDRNCAGCAPFFLMHAGNRDVVVA